MVQPQLFQPLPTAVNDLVDGFSNTTEVDFAPDQGPGTFSLGKIPSVFIGPALPPWARPDFDAVSTAPPATAARAPEALPTLPAQPFIATEPVPSLRRA